MQKSILDVEVSCFANYETPNNPKPVNLFAWLKTDKYQKQIEQLRAVENKAARDGIKKMLPAITPSGTFSYKSQACLIKHSGFIQFDIDLKENKAIENYADLKNEIKKIVHVAYCGLSVSGRGYWGLIPIAFPDKHTEHFRFIEKMFSSYNLTLDTLPKNVAALRGCSFDPDGYFNHNAIALQKYLVDDAPKKKLVPRRDYKANSGTDTMQRVELCFNEINRLGKDITSSYGEWRNVGFALAGEFGEGGRQYFHDVSQYYHRYNSTETDRKYTSLLKGNNGKITIGTFFHVCKSYGITIDLKKENSNLLTANLPNNSNKLLTTSTTIPTIKDLFKAEFLQEKEMPLEHQDALLAAYYAKGLTCFDALQIWKELIKFHGFDLV